MLASPEGERKGSSRNPFGMIFGILTAVSLATALITLAYKTSWPVHDKVNMGDTETLGIKLLTDYSMVFELVSIVLLVAILGAVVIARQGRNQ
jgi:NADH-quinone oxidoreductase subunit J